jgi:hypothetical protein|nr:MAG TPA: hypothetical protein [Caudoviricetes sp.]
MEPLSIDKCHRYGMQFPELKWRGRNQLNGDLKMKQVDDSKRFPLLSGKSPEEIVKLFNSYNFVDDHGHRLEMCQDFKDLVELASHARQR